MNTPLYQKYANTRPVAVFPLSNFGGLAILDHFYEYGEDYFITAWDFGTGYQKIRRNRVQYTPSGRPFLRKESYRFYLDEIMRI